MAMKGSYLRQQHLDGIRKELISGVSRYTILQNLKQGKYEWWEGSEKANNDNTFYDTIAEAMDTCQFELQSSRDEAKALHLERYLDLYRKCDAANDRSNARAILDSIGKLMGLNEKEQVEIQHTSYKIKLI